MSKRLKEVASREANELWNSLNSEKPLLPFLIPIFLLAWTIERWIVPLSKWIPLIVCMWATIEYGKHQRRQSLEELNNKWKRHFLCTQPSTPKEPCEWLNELLLHLWPNFLEPKLSKKLLSLVQKRIKVKKPKSIQSIEVQDFTLGIAPPTFGLQKTYWSTEGGQQVLHMGFEWDTNEMSVRLAAKLGVPFKGKVARIVVNCIHIKGDIRIVPILDGQAVLYSFESTPEVRLGIVFGSGNETLPATELPVVSSWLEKLFIETLNRTLVEPRRKCFSFPAVDLKRHAVGGILSVTVVEAKNLTRLQNRSRSGLGEKRSLSSENSHSHQSGSSSNGNHGAFVELTLADLTRKTQASEENDESPTWNQTIDMLLHGNSGTLQLNLYSQGSNHMKFDFLGRCQIKIKYVDDDSTTFWAVGPKSSVIAERAEHVGQEVMMQVPLEGSNGEVSVIITIKEWQFHDGTKTMTRNISTEQQPIFQSLPCLPTGRKIKITTSEGKNLAPKDRSGKSDPYLKLYYGKIVRKTKTIMQTLDPIWNEAFEFQEVSDEEYLKLKCYNQNLFTSDENMGSARINLQMLEIGVPKDIWVPLEKIETGEIHLKMELLPLKLESDGSQHLAEDNSSLLSSLIELVILEARDLVAADWGGTSDPFVTVHYGSIKRRTKVVYKTVTPHWNEKITFHDDGNPLFLHVKDYNTILPTSSLGRCYVDYQQIPTDKIVDTWIQLHGVDKGEIHVQVFRRRIQEQASGNRPAAGQTQRKTRFEGVLTNVHTVMQTVREHAEQEENEQLLMKIDELETAEREMDSYIFQLQKEQESLHAKVEELEAILKNKFTHKDS